MNELTYKEVWQTLSQIKVANTDRKGKFTYLSWGVAWMELMRVYPFANYEFRSETYEDNGTCMVHCDVTIGHLSKSMWLPVMDYNMNSIKYPSTRQISDARMRCLVKCIAMFGLGHYIFTNKDSAVYGEDLPDAEKDSIEAAVVEKDGFSVRNANGNVLEFAPDSATYLKHLRLYLDPDKPEATAMYKANEDEIKRALEESKNAKVSNAFKKLISLFTEEPKKEEVKKDEQEAE